MQASRGPIERQRDRAQAPAISTLSALVGVSIAVAVGGCARRNPLYEASADSANQQGGEDGDGGDRQTDDGTGDGSGGNGSAGGETGTTGDGSTTDGDESSSGSGDPSTTCGDGVVDAGEDCDDDRDFCINCREVGVVGWTTAYPGLGFTRLFGVTVSNDRVVFVGNTRAVGFADGVGAIGALDPESGEWVEEPALFDQNLSGTPYINSRLRGVIAVDDNVYAVGGARTGDGYSPVVLEYDAADGLVLTDLFEGFPGVNSRAIAHDAGVLGVGLSNWEEDGGLGFVSVTPGGNDPPMPVFIDQPDHGTNAVAVAGGNFVFAGFADNRPYVATATEMGTTPWVLQDADFLGEVQGIVPLGNDVVVTGYEGLDTTNDGLLDLRHPWVGRYALDGTLRWSSVGDERSPAIEFESAAIDGAGNVVAVGFTETPSLGYLAMFGPDGTPGPERFFDDLGPYTRLREVVYSDAHASMFVVGEVDGVLNDIGDYETLDGLVMQLSWPL